MSNLSLLRKLLDAQHEARIARLSAEIEAINAPGKISGGVL